MRKMLAASSTLVRPRAFTAAPARRSSIVVAVKPTKAADFHGLSDEEVLGKINELKVELASVRFLQRTRGISEIKPGDTQPEVRGDAGEVQGMASGCGPSGGRGRLRTGSLSVRHAASCAMRS